MTISTRLFSLQMLDQFQQIETRLQKIQTQISTGSRLPLSSDEPMDAVTLSARRELEQRIEQYQKNNAKVSDRLRLVDTNLKEASNLAIRLKELIISINTSGVTQSDRLASREEILRMKETFLALANATDSAGDTLFGGFSTEGNPFRKQENGYVKYHGDGGEHTLGVSESVKLPTSVNGSNVFMEIENDGVNRSVFDILDSVASSLVTFENISSVFDTAIGSGIQLRASVTREPQEVSFTVTGPSATKVVTATINSNSQQALADALNSASLGLTASYANGIISITSATGSGNFKISSLKLENYDQAQTAPDQFISIHDSNGTLRATVGDTNQSMTKQMQFVEEMISNIGLSRTKAGARINNSESMESVLSSRLIAINTNIGELQDADIESLITELQTILVNRDAARQTYSTVSNKSLFDFLT